MKLLDKSFKPFVMMTTILVLVSIPLFYFVVVYIYTVDADQSLINNKLRVEDQLNHLHMHPRTAVIRIRLLNELDIGYQIISLDTFPAERGDRFYTAERFDQYSNSVRPYRYLETVIDIFDKEYLLKAEVDMEEYFDVIPYTTAVAGLFFFLILIGYYLINRNIAQKVWRPFYKSLDELSSLNIQNGQTLSPIESDIDEFKKLSDNLLFYTNRSHSAYMQQKEFTENASHELQTPLAIIQSKADLLIQSKLSKEQFEIVDQINLAVNRMNRLNKNLLLLTRLENKQYLANENVNLSDVVKETLELYQSNFESKNLSSYAEIKNSIIIKGNIALIETLINSLLTNATTHNFENGKIKVYLNSKSLIIQNTGKSTALDKNKIFKRFNKDNKNLAGSGLGLAICKEIVQLHDFKISYRMINDLHSFKITNFTPVTETLI
jgi:signal transduction histidine kinase